MTHGPGTVVDGRYRLAQLLGRGGMGEVWRAAQPSLARDIALKLVGGDDPILVARFQREARAVSRVHHDNVVIVHDTGRCPATGLGYIAMELLEGGSLRALLARGALPLPRAVDIAAQMLRGLAAAHAAGIVHRDVKPENVMLVGERVKLVDFGIARGVEGGDTMTMTGSFVGTPGYTAPEVALGARNNDPKADLYAVGCVLFELLVGRPVFEGGSALAVAMKHASEPAPDVTSRRTDVPPHVAALVAALLDKDPARRPTAKAALQALEGAPPPSARPATTIAAPARARPARDASLPPGAPTETAAPVAGAERTVTATGVVAAAPGWRVLFENEWAVVDVHVVHRVVRLTRTKRRVDSDDVNQAYALVLGAPGGLDPAKAGLLLDMREAPPRNDPEFEAKIDTWLQALRGRYRAVAVVVKTAIGKLQVTRNMREHGLDVLVTHDVDEAVDRLKA